MVRILGRRSDSKKNNEMILMFNFMFNINKHLCCYIVYFVVKLQYFSILQLSNVGLENQFFLTADWRLGV